MLKYLSVLLLLVLFAIPAEARIFRKSCSSNGSGSCSASKSGSAKSCKTHRIFGGHFRSCH